MESDRRILRIPTATIEREISAANKLLKRVREEKQALIDAIIKHVFYGKIKDHATPLYKCAAALHYALREAPYSVLHIFSMKRFNESDKGFSCHVNEYGYPTRVFMEVKDCLENLPYKEMWKKDVEDDNTKESLQQYETKICHFNEKELIEFLKERLQERFVVINCPELELKDMVVLFPIDMDIDKEF